MVLQIHFTFKPFPSTCKRERKQKKERAQRTKRERESERKKELSEANADPATNRTPIQHCADRTAPRRSISPLRDLTSAQSPLRPTDLSLWFWFLLLLWWCGSGVEKIAKKLWKICGCDCDFEIFCNEICLDAEKIVEKPWKICRKIAFLE